MAEYRQAFYDAFYDAEEKARKTFPVMGDSYVEALADWMWGYMEGNKLNDHDGAIGCLKS